MRGYFMYKLDLMGEERSHGRAGVAEGIKSMKQIQPETPAVYFILGK